MVYRIRYKDAAGRSEKLATVEANSPTEAMVKFRCIYNTREFQADLPEQVVSVEEELPVTTG